MGFSDTLFSFSCLYAAVLVLYGMLSLNVDPGAARREKMSRLYGIPAAPENNQGSPQVRFFKSFCLRPTFLRGILMGVVVIRYHNDPIMSMMLAACIGAYMMSIFRKLETKFIPGAVIFCSIIFLTMHMVGLQYGWHTVRGASATVTNDLLKNITAASLVAGEMPPQGIMTP